MAAKETLTDALRKDVVETSALLDGAIQDPDYQTKDRVTLARIEGSFRFLSRSLEGFLSVGDLTMATPAREFNSSGLADRIALSGARLKVRAA